MNKLLFALFLLPFPLFAQVIVKVQSPLSYRIGLPNKWDTLCAITGNVTSCEGITIAAGTLNFGPQAIFELELFNDSTVPLVITRAYWGEPHIQPEWQKEPIAPGNTGKLCYTCHTSLRPGWSFTKSCTAHTNFGPLTVNFKGNILPQHLWLDHNTSVVERANHMKTSFSISHKICENCPDGFTIDSVLTDALTEVTFTDSTVGAGSSVTFHVTCRPAKRMPQFSRVRVCIGGTVVEHYVFIAGKKKKRSRISHPEPAPASKEKKRRG